MPFLDFVLRFLTPLYLSHEQIEYGGGKRERETEYVRERGREGRKGEMEIESRNDVKIGRKVK